MRISPRDLYRLRRAHLEARNAVLRLEMARHRLGELLLEMERRYGLLGSRGTIDIHTGEVRVPSTEAQPPAPKESDDHPERHPQPCPARPEG